MSIANPPKIDFERGMNVIPPLTILLILTNVVIFGITIVRGSLQSEEAIIAAGALVRDRVLHGEVWRLASSMFLHGGLDHLAGNCIGLYIVGIAAEHAWGLSGAAMIYFGSGLLGAVASVALHPGPSVGASGAIFGLLGGVIVFFWKYGSDFHVRDKRVGNVLLIWAAYSLGTAYFAPLIDNAAHMGGILGGGIVGLLITPRYRA